MPPAGPEELQKLMESMEKSMSQWSSHATKLHQVLGTIQPVTKSLAETVKTLDESFKNIAKSIVDVGSNMQAANNANMTAIQQAQELATQALNLSSIKMQTLEFERERERILLRQAKYWDEISEKGKQDKKNLEDSEGLFTKLGKAAQEYMKSRGPVGGTVGGTAAEMLTGASTMSGAMGKFGQAIGSIMPQMPFGMGGLLGLMLYGAQKQSEWAATGQIAAQQFERTGSNFKGFAGILGGEIRTLDRAFIATKEESVAVMKSFAEMGIKGEDTSRKIEGFSGIIDKKGIPRFTELRWATLAADQALGLAAGSMAKLAATLQRDTGMALDRALMQLGSYGVAMRSAGGDAVMFMQSIMDASSAVKLMGMSTESLGRMGMGVQRTMAGMGMDPLQAGAYAAAGVKSVGGALAGMDLGVASVIGRQLGFQGSGLTQGYAVLDPYIRGKTQGTTKIEDKDILEQMRQMAQSKAGNDPASQMHFLTGTFGLNRAGATAVMEGKWDDFKDSQKSTNEWLNQLNGMFKKSADKTDAMTKFIEGARDAIAVGSNGLLGMILSGIKQLVNLVGMAMSSFTGKFAGRTAEAWERNWMAATDEGAQQAKVVGHAITRIGSLAKTYGLSMYTGSGAGSSPFVPKASTEAELSNVMEPEPETKAAGAVGLLGGPIGLALQPFLRVLNLQVRKKIATSTTTDVYEVSGDDRNKGQKKRPQG